MMRTRLFILACGLVSVLSLAAQSPVRLEYFFDTDPGYGKATAVSSVSEGVNTLRFDPGSLATGAHVLYVRSLDDQGHWSPLVSRPVFVEQKEAAPARMEYFFDTDPGYGKATAASTVGSGDNKQAFDPGELATGAHVLYARAVDAQGRWSALVHRPVFVEQRAVAIARLEYFLDDKDPGRGQATAVAVPTELTEAFAFEVSTEGLEQGEHKVNVRALDTAGQWTELLSAAFEVVPPSGISGVEGDATASDVYDLRGHKVRIGVTTLGGLPQGVYVVRGRKVVVK